MNATPIGARSGRSQWIAVRCFGREDLNARNMDLLGDIRFRFRMLSRARAFATLAVGIGINTAVFTVTNAVLFRGFPHVDPNNRILYIGTLKEGRGFGVSYPDFQDWRAQAKSSDRMAVVSNGGLRLILNDQSGHAETCDGTDYEWITSIADLNRGATCCRHQR